MSFSEKTMQTILSHIPGEGDPRLKQLKADITFLSSNAFVENGASVMSCLLFDKVEESEAKNEKVEEFTPPVCLGLPFVASGIVKMTQKILKDNPTPNKEDVASYERFFLFVGRLIDGKSPEEKDLEAAMRKVMQRHNLSQYFMEIISQLNQIGIKGSS